MEAFLLHPITATLGMSTILIVMQLTVAEVTIRALVHLLP
jgi:hypothetical protein